MGATPCVRPPMCRHTYPPSEQEYQTVHEGRIHQQTKRNVRLVRDALEHLPTTIELLLAWCAGQGNLLRL